MAKNLKISKKDLPKKYQKYKLIKTENGISQEVYYLGNKYVLKIFDSNYSIKEQTTLHQKLSKRNLKIPKIVDKCLVGGSKALIFEKISGSSPKNPTYLQLKKVSLFAKKLHKISPLIQKKPFHKKELQNLIDKNSLKQIDLLLGEIKISPRSDTFIHGDLFVDNVKFIGSRLSGVYDFSDSGLGDKNFEYGVIALSWCKDRNQNPSKECIERVFEWVDCDFWEFLDYIGYASLFYAAKRFTLGADYQDLINFYKGLRKIR